MSQHGFFLSILFATSLLYCFIISRVSLEGDASHYAFRALGWLDWFTGQEGPLKFVGHHEWWMDLSFQDHPPAAFFIQHYFLKLFGETTFVALLPSAIAGLLTLSVTYWGVLRLASKETALWAVILLASDALATRMFTSGFHEGVTSLFIVSSFFLLLMYLETEKLQYLLTGAVMLGFSLLSKYTALFGVAGFFSSLVSGTHLTFRPQRIREQLWNIVVSVFLCTLVLTPALVYNYMLFKSAHIFDTSLAMILGTDNVFHGHATLNVPANLYATIQSLMTVDNAVFIVASLCAYIWLIAKSALEKTSIFERGLLIYTSFLFLMFAFMGNATRYIPIFIPFFALLSATGLTQLKQRFPRRFVYFVSIILIACAVGYSINTHVVPRPIGLTGITFSEERGHDFGLNKLDAYLRTIIGPIPKLEKPKTIQEIFSRGLPAESPPDAKVIIIFDDRFSFFGMWWYIERYTLYHRVSLYPASSGLGQKLLGGSSFNRAALPSQDTPVYYIEVLSKGFMNPHQIGNPWPQFLSHLFQTSPLPYVAIADEKGEPMFRVYKVNP